MASEVKTSKVMNIPVPQSGSSGSSSSAAPAARPQPKASSAPKSSFADELAKSDTADSTQPKISRPAPQRPKTPLGDRDERTNAPSKADDSRADVQSKAQESAKKLAPLKKAAANSKQAIDNAPVVALLTGHLEKVSPNDIPGLVTSNAFVADAISDADLSSFMNKPAKIGDILDDLDMPQGLADIAEQMGLDLNETVTPSELLRAIGVDPGRVTAELASLKTTLGAEGLAPYMRKAAQLAEQGVQTPPQPLEPYPGWAKTTTPPTMPQSPVTGTFDPSKVSTGTMLPSTKVASPAAPNVEAHPAGMALTMDDLQRLAENPQVAALGVTPEQLLRMLSPGMAADTVKKPGEKLQNLSPGAQPLTGLGSLGAAQGSASDLSSLLAGAQASSGLSLDAPQAPAMNKATFDAFNLLGDKLKNLDSQSVDMTKVQPSGVQLDPSQQAAASGRSLEEQLRSIGVGMNPLHAQPSSLNISGKVAGPQGLTGRSDLSQMIQVPNGPQSEIAPSDVTERIAAKPIAFSAPLAAGVTQLSKDLAPRMTMTQAIPADELRLASPMMSGRGGGAQDFGQQGEDERSKDDATPFASADRALSEMLSGKTHNSAAHGKGFTLHQANAPEVGMTSEQRLSLFQNVMDRATGMMKDGGGVVRLDLGSAGLGHLEMAVKMNDDKMDLKILTGSDRVKEAMMSEMSRLRDALSVQNVQLGQVDVGVSGRQHQPQGFNAFSGNGSFQQQQQQAFSGERHNMPERRPSELIDVSRLAEIRRPMPALAASQLFNHASVGTGRIAVRV